MIAPVAAGPARKFCPPERRPDARWQAAPRARDGWTERPEQSCAYRLDFASGRGAGGGQAVHQRARCCWGGPPRPPGAPRGDRQRRRRRPRVAVGKPASGAERQRATRAPRGSSSGVDVAAVRLPLDRERRVREGGLLRSACGLRRLRRRSHPGHARDAGGAGQQAPHGRPEPAPGRRGARPCDPGYAEVLLSPERYNALYEQFRREGKNLNTLLAWGHVRAIETVLRARPLRQRDRRPVRRRPLHHLGLASRGAEDSGHPGQPQRGAGAPG